MPLAEMGDVGWLLSVKCCTGVGTIPVRVIFIIIERLPYQQTMWHMSLDIIGRIIALGHCVTSVLTKEPSDTGFHY